MTPKVFNFITNVNVNNKNNDHTYGCTITGDDTVSATSGTARFTMKFTAGGSTTLDALSCSYIIYPDLLSL